ncbi:histidine kinase [Nonomuraea sp. NPDC050310]|uniref:sensor histidine kinase n=1 Tax=unclassified Nonomuraea TaxID=2593643 RepID=UPI0033DF85B5
MTEYRWLLPSVLLGDGREGRPVKRSTRDWIVDVALFVLAALATLFVIEDLRLGDRPIDVVEQVLAALSCISLWLRRRWPVTLCVVLTLVSAYFILVGVAAAILLFTVAVHRPFRISGPLMLLNVATLFPAGAWRPDPDLGYWGAFWFGTGLVLVFSAWGMLVRARRQLVWSLRRQAEDSAQEARRLERERIAREMHDVLAHRISILSLHAGALEFRPDASPREIAQAAGAIRASAHQALQDLREVIGVLRAGGEEAAPERPQPTLDDIQELVTECRQAGMLIRLSVEAGEVPERLGRDSYRIVQEALTNARKHAPGALVTVRVWGAPGEGLSIRVRNPQPVRAGRFPLPGAGSGLIGLAERVSLLGGRLTHGTAPGGDFDLEAWLPWNA